MSPEALRGEIEHYRDARERVFRYAESLGLCLFGGITASLLARICGVSPRTWYRWEKREREMPIAAWRLLVAVSGVDAPDHPWADE